MLHWMRLARYRSVDAPGWSESAASANALQAKSVAGHDDAEGCRLDDGRRDDSEVCVCPCAWGRECLITTSHLIAVNNYGFVGGGGGRVLARRDSNMPNCVNWDWLDRERGPRAPDTEAHAFMGCTINRRVTQHPWLFCTLALSFPSLACFAGRCDPRRSVEHVLNVAQARRKGHYPPDPMVNQAPPGVGL